MKFTFVKFVLYLNLFVLCECENVALEVQRSIRKEGFHRDLQTTVIVQHGAVAEAGGSGCCLLLIETLPPSLYVDTFQLHNLAQFGGPQVLTDRVVDIEAPEYLSQAHELYVYTSLVTDTVPPSDAVIVTITLPVHVRYHRPSSDPEVSDVSVTMYHPRVLLNCSSQSRRMTEAPCDAVNTSQCLWAELPYKSDSDFVKLRVPLGREYDVRVVVFATLVVTVIGATFLLYVIAFWDHYKVKVK